MKRFITAMVILGLCGFFLGCEKKAEEPVMAEEDVIVEEVTPPAPPVEEPVPPAAPTAEEGQKTE